MRQYWKTATMAASGSVGESPLFLLDYLLRFLRVVVLLTLWRTIFAGKSLHAGMGLETVLTYTLAAEVFRHQLECRGSGLGWAIWEGAIATRLLRPMGMFSQFAAALFGEWMLSFATFSVPLLLVSPWLGVHPMPADVLSGLAFLLSLGLAVSVGLAIEFIFGTLVVLMQNMWAAQVVRDSAVTVLSGAVLPLALLPWGLGGVLTWLPFASMASAPLQIYVGEGNPGFLMALQLGWSAVLWPLAFHLWSANQERLVSYGG